jgi:hypothetical protein
MAAGLFFFFSARELTDEAPEPGDEADRVATAGIVARCPQELQKFAALLGGVRER